MSTADQAESGLGLDAQTTAIETAAQRLNLPLAAMFTDAGISGAMSLEGRAGLGDALTFLQRDDVLVVSRRDRLARDAFNSIVIEREVAKKGARIISAQGEGTADDDPASIFMRRVLDAVAELERALIASRTRQAMAAAKARGQRAGHIPYGWRLAEDRIHLVSHPDEQAVLAELRRLRSKGYALVDIASELNTRGVRNRQGRPWRRQFIGQLLDRHPAKIA